MNSQELLKASMSAAGPDEEFGPAQLQKLMFLIDREIASRIGGPYFDFRPYDYGPFDKEVYNAANVLELNGELEVDHSSRFRKYRLTDAGFISGQKIYNTIEDDKAKKFISQAAEWVRAVSFQKMVSSIYKHYPDMKVNSIFN